MDREWELEKKWKCQKCGSEFDTNSAFCGKCGTARIGTVAAPGVTVVNNNLALETEKAIARQKSYVGAAILTFFLYWLLWLPGLIFNLMYISDARKTRQVAGQSPSGYGCLLVLFWVQILSIGVAILSILAIGALSVVSTHVSQQFSRVESEL